MMVDAIGRRPHRESSARDMRQASRFKRYLGVDLGGGRGKKTSLAILEASGEGANVVGLLPRPREAPLYDERLVDVILAHAEGALLCIDAPLSLPPCAICRLAVCPGVSRCVDPEVALLREMGRRAQPPADGRDCRRGRPVVTPYTQRATDVHLDKVRHLLGREALGQGTGPLAARAVFLCRALAAHFRLDENLLEVSPRAALSELGFREPYKKHVDRRIDILAKLPDLAFAPGVWRETCRQSDNAFDAVMSAYAGVLASRDAWPPRRDRPAGLPAQRSWIWIPPARD